MKKLTKITTPFPSDSEIADLLGISDRRIDFIQSTIDSIEGKKQRLAQSNSKPRKKRNNAKNKTQGSSARAKS